MDYDCSFHLQKVFCPELRKTAVNNIIQFIDNSEVEFDFVVIHGTGGAIGLLVADKMDCDVVIVRPEKTDPYGRRKKTEGCRKSLKNLETIKYIVIDDCVCLGGTLNEIDTCLREVFGNKIKLSGVFTYEPWAGHDPTKRTIIYRNQKDGRLSPIKNLQKDQEFVCNVYCNLSLS